MNNWKWVRDSINEPNIKAGTELNKNTDEEIMEEIKNGNVLFKVDEEKAYIYHLVLLRVRVMEMLNGTQQVCYDAEKKDMDMSIHYGNGFILSRATNRGLTPAQLIEKEPLFVIDKYVLPIDLQYDPMPPIEKSSLSLDADNVLNWLKEEGIRKEVEKKKEDRER